MFENHSNDPSRRRFRVVSVGHLAREGLWGIDAPRSYLAPVLLWFTSGQGRIVIGGEVRGYTAHNAIYLPANTAHCCDAGRRVHGTAVFFAGSDLPLPEHIIHLRLRELQKQVELNRLIESLARISDDNGAYRDDILHHQAALTLLWIRRESLADGSGASMLPAPRRGETDATFGDEAHAADTSPRRAEAPRG